MYGSNAELKERGIDPTKLLKLIKTEEEFDDDEFAYSDAEDSDDGKHLVPLLSHQNLTTYIQWNL